VQRSVKKKIAVLALFYVAYTVPEWYSYVEEGNTMNKHMFLLVSLFTLLSCSPKPENRQYVALCDTPGFNIATPLNSFKVVQGDILMLGIGTKFIYANSKNCTILSLPKEEE
jgi:hypothetical protein